MKGRDGFWLHRHLRSIGMETEVVEAASIEVSRRLRHVKTDWLDADRLLAKLIRPAVSANEALTESRKGRSLRWIKRDVASE